MEKLRATYKELLNHQLPEKYTYPVRYNHCFNRIVLDWLFSDCWYHHLDTKKTAISQLNDQQLHSAINRMNQWLSEQQILIRDNEHSLRYRRKLKVSVPDNNTLHPGIVSHQKTAILKNSCLPKSIYKDLNPVS